MVASKENWDNYRRFLDKNRTLCNDLSVSMSFAVIPLFLGDLRISEAFYNSHSVIGELLKGGDSEDSFVKIFIHFYLTNLV